jgi:hypothetical protein
MTDATAKTAASAVDVRPAWRLADPQMESDAIAFWRRLGLLRGEVTPEARAKELCTIFYVEGRVAAVSTATLDEMPFIRARLAMLRVAVDPDYRRLHLAVKAMQAGRDFFERWSQETGERAHGVGVVIQSPDLREHSRTPKWPRSGLNLIGYTNSGQQIRVAWFEHARLDQR